jgi:hypothetical protein
MARPSSPVPGPGWLVTAASEGEHRDDGVATEWGEWADLPCLLCQASLVHTPVHLEALSTSKSLETKTHFLLITSGMVFNEEAEGPGPALRAKGLHLS